ncbi:MAG: hypothetical protein IJV63_07985 [Bacteroidales bacterium]|nr:hypothetical protein [Bacteroidales bacterium]
MLPLVLLTACNLISDAPGDYSELSIALVFPEFASPVKADVGEVPASVEENAIYELAIWVFNHDTHELVTTPLITNDSNDLPHAGGVRKYALPVDRTFLLTRPKVDVFVLVNQSSINTTLSGSSSWNDLNKAIFGGSDYFSPQNPVQKVSTTRGLPMSGVGYGLTVSGEEPSLSVSKISIGRAVSKLRYIFSQMYTENDTEEEFSVQKIVLEGGQIPVEEYVFSENAYKIVPSNYVSEPMVTTWPANTQLAACEAPELYSYAGQDGPSYETLITDGIRRGQLTDCGTYYLRESDKALTGKVYYTITKKRDGEPVLVQEKTMPFSMAAPGDFARNHTWTVYGYFISNRTLQMAVSVLPWDRNNYTIEFSTSSLQVTQKFTVADGSATIVPVTGQKDHFNVFLDANKPARGYLYITTPQGGKLEIIPEGSVADLEAFDVSPGQATIDPSFNSGRIDITIDRNRSYTGDPSGKTITLSFKAYTPDGDREIAGASECVDQIYHFYL